MDTVVDEIADGIYLLSTYVAPTDFTFNQVLVAAEEPLLFHTGPRALFPVVTDAVGRVLPPEQVRWVTFAHVEADECGSMNEWLARAPRAEVAHGAIGCLVSLNDLCDRPPRMLADGEILDLGGKRVRHIDTAHVPHGWESRLLFEETTGTLLCGDLFTHAGKFATRSDGDLVGGALAAEDLFRYTSLTPATASTMRGLADLGPQRLAPMHAPAYEGDCRTALLDLADCYEERLAAALP